MQESELSTSRPLHATSRFGQLLRNLALQDFIILCFQTYMCVRAYAAPDSPDAHAARIATSILLTLTVSTLLLTRGGLLQAGFSRSLTYCVGLLVPMLCSYFALKWCLFALQTKHLDPELYQVDRLLFGETPAVILDRFVTPSSVEWFAFFYYGYFFLVASMLLGTLIFDAGRRRYELLLGSVIVVSLGHSLYTIVPGLGPHDYCAAMFKHPLIGGLWWGRVERAVQSGGALLDIFPSLHTALPLFFVLHSFRHRHEAPFKQVLLPVSVAVFNMIGATVFLRWHYGIDLIAGVMLAFAAQGVAIFAWRFEGKRADAGLRQEVWERLAPGHMELRDFNYIAGLFLIHVIALIVAATAHT
jgi:hypothetical protein